MKGYPKFFNVRTITVTVLMLFVTGVLLAPTTFEMRFDKEVPWALSPELRAWTAAIHALIAFIILLILGALWSVHMRVEWRRRRNIQSGIALVATWFALIVSGYGVYYAGEATLAMWTTGIHLAVGLFLVVVYFWHVFLFDKQKNALKRVGRARR